MAESAPIYDPDKKEPITRPDLQVLEGGGETTSPTGSLSAAPEPANLAKKEEAPTDPHQLGHGYTAHAKSSTAKLTQRFTGRRKVLAGGGIGGIIIALILFFLSLLPLKLLHIVQNLENRFSATSQNAINKESEKLLSSYIGRHIAPGLKTSCPSTRISRSCVAPISGTGPVAQLYDGWRQGRLENKLYTNYGIEIARGSDGKLRLLASGLPRNGVDITDIERDPSRNIFDEPSLSHTQFRTRFREAFANETRFKQAYLLFKYGGLLDKKYGHKRCLVGCSLSDRLTDKIQDKKLAGKAWITQRLLEPRNEMLSLVIQCVLANSCSTNIDPANRSPEGEPQSKFESDLQAKLIEFRTIYGEEKLAEVVARAEAVADKGYQRYVIEAVLSKVLGTTVSAETKEALASSVPLAGWINRVINTADFLQNSGSAIKKMTYVVNSTTMVAAFGVYATAAHEMKAGDTDSAELGSLTATLNSSKDGPGAEASPLYATLIDHKPPAAATAAAGSPFAGIAHAAAATVDKTKVYTCNDGNPVESGKLVCPEERLDALTSAGGALNSVSSFLNLPVLSGTLKVVITIWKNTVGGLLGAVGGILGNITNALIPGSVKDAISSVIEPFVKFLTGQLVPSIVSSDSSGARMFNIAAGGADVSFNDSAHHQLGGQQLLSNQQLTAILNDQAARDNAEFNNKPLYARLFDTKDSRSVAAKIVLAIPSDDSLSSIIAKLRFNPFHTLSFAHASAASAAFDDPFAVTQYGYPEDDPIFKADPEQYWNDRCADGTQTEDWYNHTVNNDATQQAENTTTNPCLLLGTAADSAGALYPGGLVEQSDTGNTSTTSAATSSTTTNGSINLSLLASDSDNIPCTPGTNDLGVVQTRFTLKEIVPSGNPPKIRLCQIPDIPGQGNNTNGVDISGGAVVSSVVSGAWAALARDAKKVSIPLFANSSFRLADSCGGTGNGSACARPGKSPHQSGAAIDFGNGMYGNTGSSTSSCSGRARLPSNKSWVWLHDNAEKYGIYQYTYEAWHWDPFQILGNRCDSST